MHTINGREAEIFRQAIQAFNEAGLPYVIGGGFAVHRYGGIWRNTNDLDIYVDRGNVPEAIEILSREGFADCGEMAAGDREWIYHGTKGNILVDVIWQSPSGISIFDHQQYERAPCGQFLDLPTRYLPADDLALAKIFTMNQHRCDWPDVLRIVRSCPDGFDWQHILDSMGEHWPVLLSFIVLFDWVYPNDACCIPTEIRDELLTRKYVSPIPTTGPTRESILDPWIYTRPITP